MLVHYFYRKHRSAIVSTNINLFRQLIKLERVKKSNRRAAVGKSSYFISQIEKIHFGRGSLYFVKVILSFIVLTYRTDDGKI